MATPLTTLRQLVRTRLLETLALTTPGSPLVSSVGTPGTRTVTYKIVAKNASGTSEASQGTIFTTGPSTFNGTNYVQLNWQNVPGNAGYDIYRTTTNAVSPITTGLIGSTATDITTFNDTGLAGDSATAPTVNTSGINSPFWTEQELFDILVLGCKDLWRAIVDLHQGHFTTIDEDNVSLGSGDSSLTGVPADCFRVLMIEPKVLDQTSLTPALRFRPKQYHSLTFQSARTVSAAEANSTTTVYYDILNAGSPVAAPSIVVAPPIGSDTDLRLIYVHVLPTLTVASDNPIPGESDNALVEWGVAWARAKERDDRSPDPAHLAVYATDKQSLLAALTPRQEQEEEEVEGLFY